VRNKVFCPKKHLKSNYRIKNRENPLAFRKRTFARGFFCRNFAASNEKTSYENENEDENFFRNKNEIINFKT